MRTFQATAATLERTAVGALRGQYENLRSPRFRQSVLTLLVADTIHAGVAIDQTDSYYPAVLQPGFCTPCRRLR